MYLDFLQVLAILVKKKQKNNKKTFLSLFKKFGIKKSIFVGILKMQFLAKNLTIQIDFLCEISFLKWILLYILPY